MRLSQRDLAIALCARELGALKWARVELRVDLRGFDRVPLDLSRNLPEGGGDNLWERVVPLVWAGIATNATKLKEARCALEQYVQVSFELSKGRYCTIVRSDKCFIHTLLTENVLPAKLQFADAGTSEDDAHDFPGDVATLILPSMPFLDGESTTSYFAKFMIKLPHARVEIDWSRASEGLLVFDPIGISSGADEVRGDESDNFYEDGESYEDDEDGESYEDGYSINELQSEPGIEYDRVTNIAKYWYIMIDMRKNIIPSINTFRYYCSKLFERYRIAAPAPTGMTMLIATPDPAAVSTDRLIALHLSRRWLALRSPLEDGRWRFIDWEEVAVALSEIEYAQITYPEFVLLSQILCWNPVQTAWEAGWVRDFKLSTSRMSKFCELRRN